MEEEVAVRSLEHALKGGTFLVRSYESCIDPCGAASSGKIHHVSVRKGAFIQQGIVPVVVGTEIRTQSETQEFVPVQKFGTVGNLFCGKFCSI